jgi:hypothetical protein
MAMTLSFNNSDHSESLIHPAATISTLPAWPGAERDDANDYAAYWRARSGFFAPLSEGGRPPDRE